MSRHTPSHNIASASVSRAWLRIFALCGGLGLTGSSLAIAGISMAASVEEPIHTTAEQLLAPQSSEAAPPSVTAQVEPPVAPASVPAFSPLRTSPTVGMSTRADLNAQKPAPAPVSLLAQQADETAIPDAAPAAVIEAPAAPEAAPAAPEAAPAAPGLAVPAQISADPDVPAGYNSVFIDPTDYSVGATKSPASPDLVFSERSTGCQITVAAGQAASGQACGAAPTAQRAASASQRDPGVQIGPVNVSRRGVSLGNTTIISREFLNEKLRPLNILRRGTEQYVFPLAMPAPITSLFGWRLHPVFGDYRFHSGTDIGAAMGTPVLATRAGQVSVSDFLGGYGLTVILRHDGNLESRYAHLSQIMVQPGEWVDQGEVIGLVGSTGNSTGPHLHFEMRQLTAQGWVAMDPQEILQYGIANLMNLIDNPMLALGQNEAKGDGQVQVVPVDLPYRPAQPNAS